MKLFEMSGRADSIHHSIDTVPDEKNFPLHAHKHCEIFYFIAGKGIYTVEGRDYPLSPGAILLFREGETHKLHIRDTEPYERIAVHLDLTAPYWGSAEYAPLRALFSDRTPGCGNLFLPTGAHAEFAESIFTRLCLPEESEAGFRTRLSALLPALLLELATLRSPAPAAAPHNKDALTVAGIVDYINRNLPTLSGVEELEQHFFLSRSSLNRLFRRSVGSSVWDFVVIKRLHAARRMIKAGKSAALAADACGFGDYSSFYRRYCRTFGESPRGEKNPAKSQTGVEKQAEMY